MLGESNLLLSLLLGVVGSFVASILWIVVLLRVRPHIEISEVIARSRSIRNEPEYLIKIRNRSRWAAINIRAELFIINVSNVPGGAISEHEGLSLKFHSLLRLSGFKKGAMDERHGWRFVTYEDLDGKWKDDVQRCLLFRVVASHELSGFSRTFEKKYYKKEDIQDADFRYGDTLEVGGRRV